MSRRFLALVLLLGCHGGERADFGPRATGGEVVVLRNAHILDGTGRSMVNSSLIVDGQRIRAVGPNVEVPEGVRVVDLLGKTIVPGLVSDHSHLGQVDGTKADGTNQTRDNILRQLAQWQAFGVTTVTSLGLNGPVFYELQPALHSGELPGADFFGADRGVGVPDGAPPVRASADQIFRPATPDEAVAAVREMATRHPTLVKIWVDDFHGSLRVKMSRDVWRAVVAEAHRHDLRVAAHVYYEADARALVEDGVDILAHGVRDRLVDDSFVTLLRNHKTWYVPTLQLDEASFIYAEAAPRDPFFRHSLQPDLAAQIDDSLWQKSILDQADKVKADKDSLAMNLANLRKLHEGGVLIGFGTDSGANPMRIPGYAEHRELALMVRAGFTPLEAIHVATEEAAKLLGLTDRGVLAPGKLADFFVVEGDPSVDIANVDRIVEVWHRGRKVGGPVESFQP